MSEPLPDWPVWRNKPDRSTPITAERMTAQQDAVDARILAAQDIAERATAQFTPPSDSPLRKWFAALANRNAAPAQVLVIGDSISEGTGATALPRRWQNILQRTLRSRFGSPTGAEWPFIPGRYQTSTPGGPATVAGTVTVNSSANGLGWRTASIADGGSVTYSFKGTRAKLAYLRASSTGTVRIILDGGAPVVIDTNSGVSPFADASAIWDTGVLTDGDHTIVATRDSSSAAGRNPFVHGVITYAGDEAAGIRVIDGAKSGIVSTTWTTASLASMNAVLTDAGTSTIKLVIIGVGTNDYASATPPSTYRANIETLMASLRANGVDASFLLVGAYLSQGRDPAVWRGYLDELEAIAAADPDTAFLDLSAMMPSIPTPNTAASSLGLYADTLHPSDAGHGWIADVIAERVSPRVPV